MTVSMDDRVAKLEKRVSELQVKNNALMMTMGMTLAMLRAAPIYKPGAIEKLLKDWSEALTDASFQNNSAVSPEEADHLNDEIRKELATIQGWMRFVLQWGPSANLPGRSSQPPKQP